MKDLLENYNTVKDLLEKKCPLSISQTRDGNVYINQTNSALRDKYLFSGCTDSNTCNTTNLDPISKNILDSIPSKGHCGAWDLGDYGWNQDTGKWVKKTVKDLLEKKCPLSISQTRDGNVYINQTNSALRDKYLFSGCTDSNTCNTTNLDPISKNILDSIPSKGHCGAWDLGDYGWNQDTGKWVNKIDYNFIKDEILTAKSIINETSDQIEKKADSLEEKQKQVYGQTKEIEDKIRLLETRNKMLELSIDRNLYKKKVIYSLFSVILAFVIIMICFYAFFNKKLNIGE